MDKPEAKLFKQLTISVEKLPASMGQHAMQTQYAAERARLLLGCYRKGEANDPDTYVAAITATLARYPEAVITDVTHPATGLPSSSSWLPTVKEVHDACEAAVLPIVQREAREKRIREQIAMRDRDARGERPTLDQMKEKYGKNWGIEPPIPDRTAAEKAAENKVAMARQQARVIREHLAAGLPPPASPYALSITARRELGIGIDQPPERREDVA